jgi:hypothetical protein
MDRLSECINPKYCLCFQLLQTTIFAYNFVILLLSFCVIAGILHHVTNRNMEERREDFK